MEALTDLVLMKDLLGRAGIVYHVEVDRENPLCRLLTINAKDGPANQGYSGFYCEWRFTAEGQLASMGIWE